MKILISLAMFAACLIGTAHAQDAVVSTTAGADDAATAEQELSREQRRELRRQQREAERAAEEAEQARHDAQAANNGVVCRRETVLGSHKRVEVCTTQAEREAARASAREVVLDVTRSQGVLGPEGQ